jgi:4-methyl-5(b-hydroxyethyl)-thiazole monophosphate biosynthesis
MKALVPIANGSEEMESVIIIDVLRRAKWEVTCVGLDNRPIQASRGVVIVPDMAWDEIDPSAYDLLVFPGGNVGSKNLRNDSRILQAVREFYEAGKVVAAVCAGPLILQEAGILKGKKVTCHPAEAVNLTATQRMDEKVVVDGNVVTSQGPGTTFQFALTLVAMKDGQEKADTIAKGMVLQM